MSVFGPHERIRISRLASLWTTQKLIMSTTLLLFLLRMLHVLLIKRKQTLYTRTLLDSYVLRLEAEKKKTTSVMHVLTHNPSSSSSYRYEEIASLTILYFSYNVLQGMQGQLYIYIKYTLYCCEVYWNHFGHKI